jgi:hypothetical protein
MSTLWYPAFSCRRFLQTSFLFSSFDCFIFYRKLIDAVKDEIYGERRQKIKERQEKIKIKEHHKRILDLNLPTEVVLQTSFLFSSFDCFCIPTKRSTIWYTRWLFQSRRFFTWFCGSCDFTGRRQHTVLTSWM